MEQKYFLMAQLILVTFSNHSIMDMENVSGQKVISTKEIGIMVIWRDLENIHGQMVHGTLAIGKTISSMVLGNIIIQEAREYLKVNI